MEANKIITQVEALKKNIKSCSLSAIERDVIRKQLVECYELLIQETALNSNNLKEEKTAPPEPAKEEYEKASNEKVEINPFVAAIEEEAKPADTPSAPAQKIVAEITEEVTVSVITKKEETESINEHFENDGASLNDRFQLSVNKGLNERTAQGDLKKLIDFNRQFVFIQELFNNDATAYMKTIEQLNSSNSLEDAFAYLNKEIVHIYKWRPELQSVKLFEKLVRQKFGA